MLKKLKEFCLNIDFNCGLIRLSNVLLELNGKIKRIDLEELNFWILICNFGHFSFISWLLLGLSNILRY